MLSDDTKLLKPPALEYGWCKVFV